MEDIYTTPLHTPPHWFVSKAIYMVTGGTLYKAPFLNSDTKRKHFCETLFARAENSGWTLEAWSVLPNHYHFMARAPENAHSLKLLIQGLHSISAKFINAIDGAPGRRVWYNYWDSCITHETSYWARLNYVHQNPVKHGVIANPEDYPYCSYRWFLEHVEPELKNNILNQAVDRLKLDDDY